MNTIISLMFVLFTAYAAVRVFRSFTVNNSTTTSNIDGVLVEPNSTYFLASSKAKHIN
ncbi:hypothetical protein [Photobacterium profundum]|uniref:hypothetical protein n=1 Tax=Photobacterium profundum TaxID=74109 RepID=UPI000322DB59|nr:hypothetical protein [Photobacterium profundum]